MARAVGLVFQAADRMKDGIEFARTAEELRQIKARADRPEVAVQELHRLARRAERVISIENQGWMAKLAEDPADQKAPEAT